jgi:DNA-binding transcriptional LysR family regulator
MTELGERMLPLLRQCYDSAISARSLASSIKSGEVGALRFVLSRSIDLSLFVPQIRPPFAISPWARTRALMLMRQCGHQCPR